jgi:hypothetical protein
MSYIKDCVVKQNNIFVDRLIDACSKYEDSKYKLHNRINWTFKFDGNFLDSEYKLFLKNSDDYLKGKNLPVTTVVDIFEVRVSLAILLRVIMKVLCHFLFRIISYSQRSKKCETYRKAYVDDIESAYPIMSDFVVKWIYPFPMGFNRQISYVIKLHKERQKWRLAGLPYQLYDLLMLIRKQTFNYYYRLESKAQILHARELKNFGFTNIELSDEFEIGSLNFAKAARRIGLSVENSAHGAGAYMPIHAYTKFRTITSKQIKYYMVYGVPVWHCHPGCRSSHPRGRRKRPCKPCRRSA